MAHKISDAVSGASWYPQLIDSPSPMVGFCREELLRHVPGEIFFPGLSALPSAAVPVVVETA